MSAKSICCPIQRGAMEYAVRFLTNEGYQISLSPTDESQHLLLPVPSFPEGWEYLTSTLESLPRQITVFGGFLNVPPLIGYKRVDFLADPYYLAQNAAITAACTLEIIENLSDSDVSGHSILILGWGRIGKCLGQLLQQKGADVTIAARNHIDLALIEALGYQAMPLWDLNPDAEFIINTVPAMVLDQVPQKAIAIELATKPGMAGGNIISARGLPGKMRPEESGKLIAETFLRLSENWEADI